MQQGGKEWGKEGKRLHGLIFPLFFRPPIYPIGQIPLSEAEPLFARALSPSQACQACQARIGKIVGSRDSAAAAPLKGLDEAAHIAHRGGVGCCQKTRQHSH